MTDYQHVIDYILFNQLQIEVLFMPILVEANVLLTHKTTNATYIIVVHFPQHTVATISNQNFSFCATRMISWICSNPLKSCNSRSISNSIVLSWDWHSRSLQHAYKHEITYFNTAGIPKPVLIITYVVKFTYTYVSLLALVHLINVLRYSQLMALRIFISAVWFGMDTHKVWLRSTSIKNGSSSTRNQYYSKMK